MRIAYVGSFICPDGDAGALRVLGVSKALRLSGHEVVLLGIEKPRPDQSDGGGRPALPLLQYQGFSYISPPAGDSVLVRQTSILSGASILARLAVAQASLGPVDAIIAYQAPTLLLLRLKAICRARAIPLICDTVEWYDQRQLAFGACGPWYWDSELRMRWVQPMADGVIAISSFLERHYRNAGCPAIRVPILVDTEELAVTPERTNPDRPGLELVYAGSPGRKDLLGNVLRGTLETRRAGGQVTIKVIGVAPDMLVNCLDGDAKVLEALGDGLIVHPRLARSEARRHIASADFLPLLRPDLRYANAGFPTKVVESLSAGVPVIANLTSDLHECLREGENAVVAKGPSATHFVEALGRALALKERWPQMRRQAVESARRHFAVSSYACPLDEFLGTVIHGARR